MEFIVSRSSLPHSSILRRFSRLGSVFFLFTFGGSANIIFAGSAGAGFSCNEINFKIKVACVCDFRNGDGFIVAAVK